VQLDAEAASSQMLLDQAGSSGERSSLADPAPEDCQTDSGAAQASESIPAKDPLHAQAQHRMGALAMQEGRTAAALQYFQRALTLDPRQVPYWMSCIACLLQAGQVQTAGELFAQARRCGLDGPAAEALGRRLEAAAAALQAGTKKRGKAGSRRRLRDGMQSGPARGEIETIRGLLESNLHAEAEAAALKLTLRSPKSPLAWELLSVVLDHRGERDGSIDAARRAAALSPEDPQIRYNLGNLLRLSGRLADAQSAYRAALALRPHHADAWMNLGVTLKELGRAEEAVPCYRRALTLDPENSGALSNLAIILWHLGELEEAEFLFHRAIALDPGCAALHSNFASLLSRRGRLAESEACCRRALELKPGFSEAWNNLGDALQLAGRNREAASAYRRAIQLKPDYPEAYSNFLFCLSHDESLTIPELFAAHLEFGRHFETPLRPRWKEHRNSRSPDRKLKVGFVSGDLRTHAVAFFLEPLLPYLEKDAGLSLHAYSNSLIEDGVTARIRSHFQQWTRVADLSDSALAAQIEADAIDILIDLSGHTNGHRLLTFARKPAPVQATWIGYPGTTGLQAMDYVLGDPFFLPADRFAPVFTEKIVHLPATAPFLPSPEAPPVNELPALRNGYLTFGSFNRPSKLSRPVVALWAKLLRALPDAKMLIGALPLGADRSIWLDWFSGEGIGPERLRLHPRSDIRGYLALHHEVDFCLDCFPYAGATTTCHALWMGVPTLTLDGATPAGREGLTFLMLAGQPGFIANGQDDFVSKGLAWAENLGELAGVRSGLRERFAESPGGRPEAIAAGLAVVLRTMWKHWCADLPPEAF
jgi:protein O-GlcNAc transferase